MSGDPVASERTPHAVVDGLEIFHVVQVHPPQLVRSTLTGAPIDTLPSSASAPRNVKRQLPLIERGRGAARIAARRLRRGRRAGTRHRRRAAAGLSASRRRSDKLGAAARACLPACLAHESLTFVRRVASLRSRFISRPRSQSFPRASEYRVACLARSKCSRT